jgi:aspartate/methionine/tyrosine aminotransferase
MTDADRNLTQLESAALTAQVNLADGHARQTPSAHALARLRSVVDGAFAADVSIGAVEQRFLRSLTRWTGQDYDRASRRLLYSASIAIDAVGKFLAGTHRVTGMMTPTFDNLPALLRLSGVPLVAVPQQRLMPACDFAHLDSLGIDALVVVLPNNPTGVTWTRDTIAQTMLWAAKRHVLLVFDLSFRMLDPAICFDLVAAGEGAGASVICIDDTGKVLSLLDTKTSVLSATADIGPALEQVCSEILLNVSSMDLLLLTKILEDEHDNEVERARSLVVDNRVRLLSALSSLNLPQRVMPRDVLDTMSVEWLFLGPRRDDIVEACARRGLHVLPGDRFHWESGDGAGRQHIRLALSRDPQYFERGVKILQRAVVECGESRRHG